MTARYIVTLTDGEREQLRELLSNGRSAVRRLKRAQILLAAERGDVSRETVRRRLAENDLKPWRKKMWCIPKVDTKYVARMEDVLDNLSAHEPSALYEAYEPALAREVLRRLEFHFVPKHASWLTMVEIEIGTVLASQCLARRIPDREMLISEVASWQRLRNESGANVKWMFDVARARQKLGRVSPTPLLAEHDRAA